MKGMDVASRLLDLCPKVDIVFVTAYDQYAVEAFELHALDYVLKPVEKERMAKTIQRIFQRGRGQTREKKEKNLVIKTFGSFSISWSGEVPIKWRTEKTKELFAYLFHNNGREVSNDELLETVFYGMDLERAVHQLHNGIYYIRKTLQEYGVESHQILLEKSYWLKLGDVEADSLSFKQNLQQAEACVDNLEHVEAVIDRYTADYFEGADWLWVEAERETLRKEYVELLIRVSERYLYNGNHNRAEELLLKAYKINSYIEKIISLLLELYRRTNRRDMAIKLYNDYEKILKEELRIVPSQNVRMEFIKATNPF